MKFQQVYFDKLRLNDPPDYFRFLRHELRLNRPGLAKLIGVSEHTVRRYESKWPNSKAPKWYPMLLRFMAGDVSWHGGQWTDCRIRVSDKLMENPHHEPLSPGMMHTHYNRHLLDLTQDNRRLRSINDQLHEQVKQLTARITILENENATLKAHKTGLKSGKVIPLFKH